jgi:signal peptide peptidase SppA
MSDQAARSALSRMNLHEVFIAHHYQGLAADLAKMAATDPAAAREKFMTETRHELCEAYGFTRREQSKPFAFADGFAIIPVHGTLINRFGASYGYVTGYNFIRNQHNAAMLDPDVKYIVHDHNSYGGEAAGCFELADEIYDSRGDKPIIAVVDSNCYSASMALASSADKIFVTPSSGVGSIGVVAMHVDMSKMLADWGINITFIHSGDHKVDGNPYEKLDPAVKKEIQAGVDKSRAKFVSLVARNLGLDEKVVYDTEARTYRAEDALKLGLVHAIAVPSAALQSLIDEESDSPEDSDVQLSKEKETTMDPTQGNNTPAAGQPAATVQPAPAANAGTVDQAAVQKAERERVSGILNCEEAAGKSKMANHLAFNTNMSLADAKAMLAVAGKDEAAAPAQQQPADSGFAAAMSRTGNPQVGADGSVPGQAAQGGEKPNAAAAIMADYERASGIKLADKA